MARKSSYQKLKDRNKELALEIHKLSSDIEYRITAVLKTSLAKEVNTRICFGEVPKTGKQWLRTKK